MKSIRISSRNETKIQEDLNTMQKRLDDYKDLRDRYHDFLVNRSYVDSGIDTMCTKKIWICWLQGIANAPDLVKRCYDSLNDRFYDYEKTLITNENIEKYVTIDAIVMDKWKKDSISNTAFSNILRLELLLSHGGVWLDSTVLCTDDKFPEYIVNSPLFVYSFWKWISGDVRPVSTWLMASCKNNIILRTVRDLLVNYWNENDKQQTYFMFHMFFEMAIEKFPDLFKMTPRISNIPSHMMQFELMEHFDEVRFEQLKSMSGFHKLSYKLPESLLLSKGTLYHHIVYGKH